MSRVELQYDDIGQACIRIRDTNERDETKFQDVPIGQLTNSRLRQQLGDIKLTGELHTVLFTVLGGPLSMHAWSPRWVPAGETKKVAGLTACNPLTLACPVAHPSFNTPYSGFLLATGGVGPYTFFLQSGTLRPA